jgi:hypothetical protein
MRHGKDVDGCHNTKSTIFAAFLSFIKLAVIVMSYFMRLLPMTSPNQVVSR